jgi:hypothetical protein
MIAARGRDFLHPNWVKLLDRQPAPVSYVERDGRVCTVRKLPSAVTK